jgi:hypothetical protein
MAVRKFRSVEEMPGPPPLPPMDPDNLKLLIGITDVAYGLHPWRFPPGVRKFRSMEEANLLRRAWEREQVLGGSSRGSNEP